jgi:hypothetical protein
MEFSDPIWTKDLSDNDDAMCNSIITESYGDIVFSLVPKIDRHDPNYVRPRKDNELPLLNKSRIDKDDPTMLLPIREKLDP